MSPSEKAKIMHTKYGKDDAIRQAMQILYLSPSNKLDYWNKVVELIVSV